MVSHDVGGLIGDQRAFDQDQERAGLLDLNRSSTSIIYVRCFGSLPSTPLQRLKGSGTADAQRTVDFVVLLDFAVKFIEPRITGGFQ